MGSRSCRIQCYPNSASSPVTLHSTKSETTRPYWLVTYHWVKSPPSTTFPSSRLPFLHLPCLHQLLSRFFMHPTSYNIFQWSLILCVTVKTLKRDSYLPHFHYNLVYLSAILFTGREVSVQQCIGIHPLICSNFLNLDLTVQGRPPTRHVQTYSLWSAYCRI